MLPTFEQIQKLIRKSFNRETKLFMRIVYENSYENFEEILIRHLTVKSLKIENFKKNNIRFMMRA